MILIEKTGKNGEQKTLSKEFMDNKLCYTQSESGDFIYLLKEKALFRVNHVSKSLEFIDVELKKEQINQIKNILPEVHIENTTRNGGDKKYSIKGRGMNGVVLGEAIITKIEGLEKTCYQKNREFSNQFGIFKIPLNADEVIRELKISINLQGNSNITNSAVSKVEFFHSSRIPEIILEVTNYKKDIV